MSDKNSEPLVDNGFKIIPQIQMSTHEQLTAMIGGGILFGLLKLIIKMDGNNYTFATILSRYSVICAIAILCRVMSFLSTIVPAPHVHCHNEDFNPPTGWGIITKLNLAKGCGDLIFSSHMMHFLCPLFVVIWYLLPSYDEKIVIKYIDRIRDLESKMLQCTEPLQVSDLKLKVKKTQKKLQTNYRSDMIRSAEKMRRFNWRWAIIAFLPFFTLIFVVLVISSRGHYTVDVVVSLYFIPFMSYFVMHHWKEEIGKTFEKSVSSKYPKLCKDYIQILNNEDLSNQQQNQRSEDNFQVIEQNGTETTTDTEKKKMPSLTSKYEAVNGQFRKVVDLTASNGKIGEEEEDVD